MSDSYMPSPARCNECGELLPSRGKAMDHARLARHLSGYTYVCTECKFTFASVVLQAKHRDKTKHMTNISVPSQALGDPSATEGAICPECDMLFASADILMVHRQSYHPQAKPTPSPPLTPIEEPPTEHKCPICQKVFLTTAAFNEHAETTKSCNACKICLPAGQSLDDHYWEFSFHPKCRPCALAFESAAAWNAHKEVCRIAPKKKLAKQTSPKSYGAAADTTTTKALTMTPKPAAVEPASTHPEEASPLLLTSPALRSPAQSPANTTRPRPLELNPEEAPESPESEDRSSRLHLSEDEESDVVPRVDACQIPNVPAPSSPKYDLRPIPPATSTVPLTSPMLFPNKSRLHSPAASVPSGMRLWSTRSSYGDHDTSIVSSPVSTARSNTPQDDALSEARTGSTESSDTISDHLSFVAASNRPRMLVPNESKGCGTVWHCRACRRDPCRDPVVLMCGHFFCHGCALGELSNRLSCPVCEAVFFVRLLV